MILRNIPTNQLNMCRSSGPLDGKPNRHFVRVSQTVGARTAAGAFELISHGSGILLWEQKAAQLWRTSLALTVLPTRVHMFRAPSQLNPNLSAQACLLGLLI